MKKPQFPSGVLVVLACAAAAWIGRIPASAQEQPQNPSAPTDTPVIKHGKMDPRHPLHVGSDYYPKESLKHHEQGRCVRAFYINADGSVPAAQLLKSSDTLALTRHASSRS